MRDELNHEIQVPSLDVPKLWDDFTHSEYLTYALIIGGIGAYQIWQKFKGPPPIKGSAYWATQKEVNKALEIAKAQYAAPTTKSIGYVLGNVPLCNAVTSVLTFGAPESGKSYGVLNQLIFEHLRRGMPSCIVDLQYPEQTSKFIPIAHEFGYAMDDIHLFVPGLPESQVWNPVHQAEGLAAIEMSAQVQDNVGEKDEKRDSFFSPGVRATLAGLMSLSRHILGIDNLLGCRALISIPDIAKRIQFHIDKIAELDPWIESYFDQLISSIESPETEASLRAAVQAYLQLFSNAQVAPAITGPSSFPLYLEGKKLLIIGATPQLRKNTAPLLMALLSQVIKANAIPGRKDVLQVNIDEVFSANYLQLIANANENRKYGVYFNIGGQNMNQAKERFGEAGMRNLLTGFRHKFWFNPGENESAKYLETALGTQILRKTNFTYGKHMSRSPTEDKKPLLSVADVNKLPRGTCIVQSAGIKGSNGQEYVPLKIKIKPSALYVEMLQWAESQWDHTRAYLIKRSPQVNCENILQETRQIANQFLPPITPRDYV